MVCACQCCLPHADTLATSLYVTREASTPPEVNGQQPAPQPAAAAPAQQAAGEPQGKKVLQGLKLMQVLQCCVYVHPAGRLSWLHNCCCMMLCTHCDSTCTAASPATLERPPSATAHLQTLAQPCRTHLLCFYLPFRPVRMCRRQLYASAAAARAAGCRNTVTSAATATAGARCQLAWSRQSSSQQSRQQRPEIHSGSLFCSLL
jgi:hypothetical protein